jgi:tRNA(fMet)-specific endonuclease VapC
MGGVSSVISQIEFLAFAGLSADDQMLFTEFLQRVEVVGLLSDDTVLLDEVIRMRRQYEIKVPDAIIAAMAVTMSATLVTADKGFNKILGLPILVRSEYVSSLTFQEEMSGRCEGPNLTLQQAIDCLITAYAPDKPSLSPLTRESASLPVTGPRAKRASPGR